MPLFLLSLTPFAAFTVLSQAISIEIGLWAGAILALGLVLSDGLRPESPIKAIDAGSTLLFGGLALYTLLIGAPESLAIVRVIVNGGLLFIAVLSLVAGRPFTAQYARETAAYEALSTPSFLKANYVITGVWVAVFAVTFAASLFAAMTTLPHWLERLVVYAALTAGFGFTLWYVRRARQQVKSEI